MDQLLADESDAEMTRDLSSAVKGLGRDLEKLELAALLSGEYDAADAVATVNAGAGGAQSQD